MEWYWPGHTRYQYRLRYVHRQDGRTAEMIERNSWTGWEHWGVVLVVSCRRWAVLVERTVYRYRNTLGARTLCNPRIQQYVVPIDQSVRYGWYIVCRWIRVPWIMWTSDFTEKVHQSHITDRKEKSVITWLFTAHHAMLCHASLAFRIHGLSFATLIYHRARYHDFVRAALPAGGPCTPIAFDLPIDMNDIKADLCASHWLHQKWLELPFLEVSEGEQNYTTLLEAKFLQLSRGWT